MRTLYGIHDEEGKMSDHRCGLCYPPFALSLSGFLVTARAAKVPS
jgi:hypothetical protein